MGMGVALGIAHLAEMIGAWSFLPMGPHAFYYPIAGGLAIFGAMLFPAH